MDSLLKEIDDEMENTRASEWDIPLQELGDETIEMLFNRNITGNDHLHDINDLGGLRTVSHGSSSFSRKSVDFTEESQLQKCTEVQGGFRNRSDKNSPLQWSVYESPVKERCTDEREVEQSDSDLLNENEEDKDGQLGPYPLSSKIPLTNAVKINNFNLKATTSRISSGSSYIGSSSDLETSTINAKYKSLEYNLLDDNKAESISPSSAGDHNLSSAHGFITDYESARESIDGSSSELVSQCSRSSVENLDASISAREASSVDGCLQSLVASRHDGMPIEEESCKSHDVTVNNSGVSCSFVEVNDSRNTIDHEDFQWVIPRSISEMTEANNIIPTAQYSELAEDPNGCSMPAMPLMISRYRSESPQGSNISIDKSGSDPLPCFEKKAPNLFSLIPMMEPGPIFNDDPFEEVFDSSEDSLDLMRSVKPVDYISIWHSQADRFRSHSPAASSYSQFSERSFSSKSCASISHTRFSFVSRLVRRCRYYNPKKEQHLFSNSDDDDDDLTYVVDHTMDPRNKNSLISKQVKDSLENNKKSKPPKLNAIGLCVENSKEQKKDDNLVFETYPVTFSSTPEGNKTGKQIVDIERDDSLMVNDYKLERGLSAGTSENSHISYFQDYEHFAPFISTPEVSHAEIPQSPLIGRASSIRHMSRSRETESHPTILPKYTRGRGKFPIVFPPADPNRNSNVSVLSPPPSDISKRDDLLTLSPAPKFCQVDEKRVIEGTSSFNIGWLSAEEHKEIKPEQQEFVKHDLSPIPRNDPVSIVHSLESDGNTLAQPTKTRRDGRSIWNEGYNVIESRNRSNSISPEVLDKLLRSECSSNGTATAQSRNSPLTRSYIKSPNDNVLIGKGLSESGLEAVISTGEVDEGESVLFDEFYNGSICQTPTQSSIGKLHVKSPLKPATRSRSSKCEVGNSHHKREETLKNNVHALSSSRETILHHTVNSDIDSKSKNNSELQISSLSPYENYGESDQDISTAREVRTVPTKETGSSLSSELLLQREDEVRDFPIFPDAGTLYLGLKGVFGINLNGVKRRNAQFAIEIDNGHNVSQTSWKPMIKDGYIELNDEFEIVLSENPDKQERIIMTLKCRYEKRLYEPKVEEIIEKVSVRSKKRLFGKKKERYEYQKKLIPKPPKLDKWEYIFAQDGSFGRYELNVDKDFLEYTKFQVRTMRLDLKNEWARQHGASGKKPYQLPRMAPHVIGKLQLDVCYLCRTSVLEKFPRSLSFACAIRSKYESLQRVFKEGYLLQKGGDLHDEAAKRFFRLRGNKLIGYHEATRKAKIIINLLRVSDVIPPRNLNSRIFNRDIEAQGSFHLIFANKEIITFDTEFSTKEKCDWYRKIDSVVDLNKSHQPWVKAFYEKFINNA